MAWNGKFIDFVKKYKGFSIILTLELIVIFFVIIMSLGEVKTYVLDSKTFLVNDPTVILNKEGAFFIAGRDEAEVSSRCALSSDKLYMPWGMYEIEVNYTSAARYLEENGDDYSIGGTIQIHSKEEPFAFQYKEMNLRDGAEHITDRLWIRSPAGIKDLEVQVCCFDRADLYISNVIIRELWIWRITRILTCLFLFIAIDVCYIYFFTDNPYQNQKVVAGLAATVIISSLPLFADFLFSGHDLKVHLSRIWALAQGLKDGHWIMPIETELNNGYGHATPLFYSPLFLYIPAILHYYMAVPLQTCYQIYAVLCNIATCLTCYYCVKWLLQDKTLAVIISFLYTCSAYRIVNIYIRAAVGEYTAMVFYPLVLYGFSKIYLKEDKITWKEYLPVVVGLSGLIQCHILSCEIAALFIVIVCVICIKKTLQPKRFLGLVKAALLTVGLNLGFLVPFLQSMQMDIVVKDTMNKMQLHGTYLLQVLGIMMTSNVSISKVGMTNEMPMSIGFALIVGLTVFMMCCAKRYIWRMDENKLMRAGVAYTGFAVLCIVCSMRVFPWDSLYCVNEELAKVFCTIQFPWRYLAVGTVFCAFAAGIGIKYLDNFKNGIQKNVICGIMVLLTLINLGYFYMDYGNHAETMNVYALMGRDDFVAGEYFLSNAEADCTYWRNIVADDGVTVEEYEYIGGITAFWCKNTADTYKNVEIPLFNYDNYHAYALNGGQELNITNGKNDVVRIAIEPNYEGMVQVRYEIPLLWKLSYAVSAITIIGIIAVIIYGRKLEKRI